VYRYLYESVRMGPQWNFGKYLVSRAGRVIQFWNQKYSPLSLVTFTYKHVHMAIVDDYEYYDVHKEL